MSTQPTSDNRMSQDSSVRLVDQGGVHTIWLCNSKRGNAMSSSMVEALIEAVSMVSQDRNARMLVLRAEGAHFCTGFDMGALDEQSDADLMLRFVRIETLLSMLWTADFRTLALASGRTWGAGADLFAACDERWVLPTASFRFPGAAFGIVLGSRRLASRVGPSTARRWIATGSLQNAEEAVRHGLANRSVDPGQQDEIIREEADAIVIEPAIYGSICRATQARDTDTDLAALVRSAAKPGLADRLKRYRDIVAANKSKRIQA